MNLDFAILSIGGSFRLSAFAPQLLLAKQEAGDALFLAQQDSNIPASFPREPTLLDLGHWPFEVDALGIWIGVALALRILISILLALLAGRLIAWLSQLQSRPQPNQIGGWPRLVVATQILVFLGGFSLALRWWTHQASPMGLVSGILAMACFGIIFRNAIDNTVAGLVATLRGSIHHGESIEVNDVRGTVHQIALTHTQILDNNGSTFWIPNRILSRSVLRVGKIKNVTVVSVPLPDTLTSEEIELLRNRAHFCPYRRAESPVRILQESEGRSLEIQTWTKQQNARIKARVEQWVQVTLDAIRALQDPATSSDPSPNPPPRNL